MVIRFPQDCWDKGCPYFDIKYDEERDDTVCRCKLSLTHHCYSSGERCSTKICPKCENQEEGN